MINCIAETKGRYGQNIVLGTLLGANRARLKEVGANSYKSYGVLAHRKEEVIRTLLNQMLAEGYIVQTDGEYSVLRMGDIGRLKQADTRVIVRTFVEKEKTTSSVEQKKRSTDVLTGAGFKLFEKLRQLRLVIAKEEAMPPYIIFSDKTLIDMCAKTPVNKMEMLTVSGVAENKYNKYGERFIAAITTFISENPNAVISTPSEEDAEPIIRDNKRNAGASWTEEEDNSLIEEFEAGMKLSEIAKLHGRTNGAIRSRLKKHEII